MEVTTVLRHKRSMSDPTQRKTMENTLEGSHPLKWDMGKLKKACVDAKKRQSHSTEDQSSLIQEIFELQEQLKDQFAIRCALKKALACRSVSVDGRTEELMPKAASNLIKETALLELEVVFLEQYLLSLYREKFKQRHFSSSTVNRRSKTTPLKQENTFSPTFESDITSKFENLEKCRGSWEADELLDCHFNRCSSSLSQRSASSIGPSLPVGAPHSYFSQPLTMMEHASATSTVMSLGEHIGTHIYEHVSKTPNWISEEMIKCVSAIFCKLGDPSLTSHGFPSSPISFSSSLSEFPTQYPCNMWSPECKKNSSFNSQFIGDSKEFSGPNCTMLEVQWMCRDNQKLKCIEDLLKNYRSLVSQLQAIDPSRMKHDEKLAFWINVHNSLVMHAFLVYGVPKSIPKRISLLLKAAYKIGGHAISVDIIQSSILRCRMPRPRQWLRSLCSSKTKLKAGALGKAYATQPHEPLLHFALCSGSHSDPMVRLYSPKRIYQQLEAAKEEYIKTTFCIKKGRKILLPKVVESFAKDLNLCPSGLVKMIEPFLPHSVLRCQRGNLWKNIEWIPHNFSFRYLLSEELV